MLINSLSSCNFLKKNKYNKLIKFIIITNYHLAIHPRENEKKNYRKNINIQKKNFAQLT